MRKTPPRHTRRQANESTNPIVGLCFHIYGADYSIARQGKILAQVDPKHFLVAWYDFAREEWSTSSIVHLDSMALMDFEDCRRPGACQFYDSEAFCSQWYDEHRIRLRIQEETSKKSGKSRR